MYSSVRIAGKCMKRAPLVCECDLAEKCVSHYWPYSHFETLVQAPRRSGGEPGAAAVTMAGSVIHRH